MTHDTEEPLRFNSMWRSSKKWTTAKKQVYNGETYDSGFEMRYAQELDIRKKAKEIKSWERQIKIPLIVNGYVICNYTIDFIVYHPNGLKEYVETKGWATPTWRLKWSIFQALYGNDPTCRLTVVKQVDNFTLRKLKKAK